MGSAIWWVFTLKIQLYQYLLPQKKKGVWIHLLPTFSRTVFCDLELIGSSHCTLLLIGQVLWVDFLPILLWQTRSTTVMLTVELWYSQCNCDSHSTTVRISIMCTLLICTPPFSCKRWYSNSFVHVKWNYYSIVRTTKTQARWDCISDIQKCEKTRSFCSWYQSYSQGHQWRRGFQPSLASYALCSVVLELYWSCLSGRDQSPPFI